MPEHPQNDLTNLVNASGFAFQMGIEQLIRKTEARHKFTVIASEHPWRDRQAGQEGFIDLLLERGPLIAVVECKRPKDATWVFLVPKDAKETHAVHVLWTAGAKNKEGKCKAISGLGEINLIPPSQESMFCVVRGTGEGDRSLLERLGSQLVRSTECVANEEIGLWQKKGAEFSGFYLPIIVTTARLQVCQFDPSTVSLDDGTIPPDSAFSEVGHIRFRKSLIAAPPRASVAKDLADISVETEYTVLVVNADHLVQVLEQFSVSKSDPHFPGLIQKRPFDGFGSWPWEVGIKQIKDG